MEQEDKDRESEAEAKKTMKVVLPTNQKEIASGGVYGDEQEGTPAH